MKILLLFAVIASAYGCTPAPMIIDHPPYQFDTRATLDANVGETWDALMLVLQTFPLDGIDPDNGTIITAWMDDHAALHLMRHPVSERRDSLGLQFGMTIADLAPGLPYVAWLDPGGPADRSGVRERDIIVEVNGVDTNDIDDLAVIMGESELLQLTLIRGDGGNLVDIEITASGRLATHTYVPFPCRYRLHFTLVPIQGGRTLVSIESEVEVDFDAFSGRERSRMQRVKSSTIKEWLLLGELEAELGL